MRCAPVPARAIFVGTALFLLAARLAPAAETPVAPPLYALIVGGGPDLDSNAAQIEGHVRFAGQILPPGAKHIVLFADGKPDSLSVAALDVSAIADEKRALAVLLPDDVLEPVMRAPKLGLGIDGPARLQDLHRAVTRLAGQEAAQPAPVLLFFAGHGTQDENKEENTQYDLWDNDELCVRDLAAEIARLPSPTRVTLVMAQCYSGAFANVLFRGGEPNGAPVTREISGFFSARKDRIASGCSRATTAADYQDFSSFFLAALCRHDRFGQAVESADFDGDGKVTLHEAFCYALIHDESVDTPVATSDAFLKRFAPLTEADIHGQPYGKIWQAATPAQRAALDALSQKLGLSGEQRPVAVFDRLRFSDPIARAELTRQDNAASERRNTLRQSALQALFLRCPGLRWSGLPDYSEAVAQATAGLAQDKAGVRALLEADKVFQDAEDAVDNDEAMLLRFSGLCESVVRAQDLRAHGKPEIKAQFERVWQAEQAVLPVAEP